MCPEAATTPTSGRSAAIPSVLSRRRRCGCSTSIPASVASAFTGVGRALAWRPRGRSGLVTASTTSMSRASISPRSAGSA